MLWHLRLLKGAAPAGPLKTCNLYLSRWLPAARTTIWHFTSHPSLHLLMMMVIPMLVVMLVVLVIYLMTVSCSHLTSLSWSKS